MPAWGRQEPGNARAALTDKVGHCMRLWGSAGPAAEVLVQCRPWRLVEQVILYNVEPANEADTLIAQGQRVFINTPSVRRVFAGRAIHDQGQTGIVGSFSLPTPRPSKAMGGTRTMLLSSSIICGPSRKTPQPRFRRCRRSTRSRGAGHTLSILLPRNCPAWLRNKASAAQCRARHPGHDQDRRRPEPGRTPRPPALDRGPEAEWQERVFNRPPAPPTGAQFSPLTTPATE